MGETNPILIANFSQNAMRSSYCVGIANATIPSPHKSVSI